MSAAVGAHRRNTGPMRTSPRCGAKTRSGRPCGSPKVAGAARCRMHGGRGSGAPLGNRNAYKHGRFDAGMRKLRAEVSDYARLAREMACDMEQLLNQASANDNLWSELRYLLNEGASDGSTAREGPGDLPGLQRQEICAMPSPVSQTAKIAWARPVDDCGKVAFTFCQSEEAGPAEPFTSDFKLDWPRIEAWNAAAVVFLGDEQEHAAAGITYPGAAIIDETLIQHHLPLGEGELPGELFDAVWEQAGEELRAVVRSGFNVIFHAKGGPARAALAASQLLIELGAEPARLVSDLRRQVPGVFSEVRELDYVMGLSPLGEILPDRSVDAAEDRAVGALLGLAVSDAHGHSWEFEPASGEPSLQYGEWTDDTAMTLALMESLLAYPSLNEADVMDRLAAWHERGEYSCTGRCTDIRETTRTALMRYKQSGDPFAGSTNPAFADDGALMRTAAVAVRHWRCRETLRDIAARQSRLTHGAPEAVDAAVALAEVLADAIAGYSRSEILRRRVGAWEPRVASVLAGSWCGKHSEDMPMPARAARSLEMALWWVGRTGTYAHAIDMAEYRGGEAHTGAVVAGQIAGALYGMAGVEGIALERLAWREQIEQKARELFRASL